MSSSEFRKAEKKSEKTFGGTFRVGAIFGRMSLYEFDFPEMEELICWFEVAGG